MVYPDGLEALPFSDEWLHVRNGCDPKCPIALDRKEQGTKLIKELNEGAVILTSGTKVLPLSAVIEGGELHDSYAQYVEIVDSVEPVVCMESEVIISGREQIGLYCATVKQEIYFDGRSA